MDNKIPENYQKDIEVAVDFLKSEGCEAVYLFGSLLTGNIHERSDIDLGIKGLPPKKFFRVYAKLDDRVINEIDLVDFDEQSKFYDLLCSLGEVIKLG
ncbi:MAG: nucleotidyltransferase domain-containing protein [Candidatus Cloacimonetes bacterium]|nr:nucleotidyltransferase domain-containing protein [Candidatus Cloacimonadota bacterium]